MCTAYLRDTQYEHVCRASTVSQLESVVSTIRGPALLWLDLVGQTGVEDLSAMRRVQCESLHRDTHVLVTIDDACVKDDTTCAEQIEDLLDSMEVEEFDIAQAEGAQGVRADDLYDEIKIVAQFGSESVATHSLLEVFDAKRVVAAMQTQLQRRPVVGIYQANEGNAVWARLCFSDVGFLHGLRDRILTGSFGSELQAALNGAARKEGFAELGELTISIDTTQFAQRYATSVLMLDQLTPHQAEKLDLCLATDEDIHLRAAAGGGKTFVALHLILQMLMRKGKRVLFVARNRPLAMQVAKWVAQRVKGSSKRASALSRLQLLVHPFGEGPRAITLHKDLLVASPVGFDADVVYDLQVIDECHHIYHSRPLRKVVEEDIQFKRRLLLSDISQGLVSEISFPQDLLQVELTEVVRSSKRIVAGAMKFQLKGDDDSVRTKCHHDAEGPPLKSFLFDLDLDTEDQFEKYAEQIVAAIRHIDESFPGLNVHNQLAIIVPDQEFRRQLLGPLEKRLHEDFPGRLLKLVDGDTSSSTCAVGGSDAVGHGSEEWVVLDEMPLIDGME
jgi:hypothetical protein